MQGPVEGCLPACDPVATTETSEQRDLRWFREIQEEDEKDDVLSGT